MNVYPKQKFRKIHFTNILNLHNSFSKLVFVERSKRINVGVNHFGSTLCDSWHCFQNNFSAWPLIYFYAFILFKVASALSI